MRPVQLTQTGVGATAWIRPDRRAPNLGTLIVTRLVSGTAAWNLEVTEQDPPTLLTPLVDPAINGASATTWVVWNGYVWQWVRLNVTSGTGVVMITFLQGGP